LSPFLAFVGRPFALPLLGDAMLRRSILVIVLAAAPAFAQSAARPTSGSATAEIRKAWETARGYLMDAAMEVPESTYAFRPTPDVRTFGELIAHLAGAQDSFCASALGEPRSAEDAVEKSTTTKAALIDALKKSSDHCARAYAMSDQEASKPLNTGDEKGTRLSMLVLNLTHDNEHYGNIVTYMRMNHMIPPSSKPRK
jgi:uncharacterized damage-inducible protein DinB